MDNTISSDMLRGHTDTIILSILKTGDHYGYEIFKTIQDATGELFELKEATLYAAFRRLEKNGCITSYWGNQSQGGRRKYFQITFRGKLLQQKNVDDWRFTNRILSELFKERY